MNAILLLVVPVLLQEPSASIVKEILNIKEGWKFLISIFFIVVVPNIVNLINNILNRKNVSKLNKDYTDTLNNINTLVKVMDSRVKAIAEQNFDECSPKQIEVVFKGCATLAICELITKTKRLIEINHIDNRRQTEAKIKKFVKDTFNATKADLSSYKRKGVPASSYIDDVWITEVALVIIDYVYTCTTRYDDTILSLRLNETYTGIGYTFNKNVFHSTLSE